LLELVSDSKISNTAVFIDDCDDIEIKLNDYFEKQIIEGFNRLTIDENKVHFNEKYFSVESILELLNNRKIILDLISDENYDVISRIFIEKYFNSDENIKCKFLQGDIEEVLFSEHVLLQRRKYNLVLSNATFQWLVDKISFFKNLHDSLDEDGILCFSSFGRDNLKEIIEIFNPENGLPLNYFMLEEYENILKNSGFEIIYKKIEERKIYFDKPVSVLKHFRDTGVNAVSGFEDGHNKKFSKKDLQYFIEQYTNKFTDSQTGKIYLTYNPIYVIAKKVK